MGVELLLFFSFHILCYFQNIKQNIEKCPFTYWLNGRWFLQIVDRDSWNLYPLYPLFPCSDFVSQMWGGFGGGGGCNVFLTFYAISNIYRKKHLGIQNNYFSFNVFFVFFLYAGNIEEFPITYSYWLNGRWFLQIVDTVVPLIRGHLGARPKVSLHRRCPLIRGTAFRSSNQTPIFFIHFIKNICI